MVGRKDVANTDQNQVFSLHSRSRPLVPEFNSGFRFVFLRRVPTVEGNTAGVQLVRGNSLSACLFT